jgi:hypothetical protein
MFLDSSMWTKNMTVLNQTVKWLVGFWQELLLQTTAWIQYKKIIWPWPWETKTQEDWSKVLILEGSKCLAYS